MKTKETAQWKRYPHCSGRARFVPYFVTVEVVARETREVLQLFVDNYTGKSTHYADNQEWAQIRFKGRLRWIRENELS